MSDPLRIALVAEGPTDRIVIKAAIQAILHHRAFVLTQLQPEGSSVFGTLGAGWGGVYRWCKQAARRGAGRLAHDRLLFQNYDILVLHLDADVADKPYEDISIEPSQGDAALPCALPCPPPADTTNRLRVVLLSWCGEVAEPQRTVVCMPSKSIEAWVMAALFPNDQSVRTGIECFPDPESRLGQQPRARRIRKKQCDYQDHSAELKGAWPRLLGNAALSEAQRFQNDFLAQAATM